MNASAIQIIYNPASGRGRGAGIRPLLVAGLRSRFGDSCELHETRASGEATVLAAQACCTGCKIIVAVGGDGTLGEVVNGILSASGSASIPLLGVVSTGTGNGFAQSLGFPQDIRSQLDVLLHGNPASVDVGKIVYSLNGRTATRIFLNECQIGLGARVVASTSRFRKSGCAAIAYGITSLTEIFRSVPCSINVANGVGRGERFSLLGIAVANGPTTAGGMRLVPRARPDDGQLDALLILNQPRLRLALSFARVYSGTHTGSSGFRSLQSKCFTLTSGASVPVSADGESIGTLPCSISVLAGALQVQLPKGRKP